jgi:hypothetical protein
MTLKDRIAWVGSWVAPVAGWIVVIAFAALVMWPRLRRTPADGRIDAWVISFFVLLWFAGHLAVRLHGSFAADLSRDERAELHFKLNLGRGYSHWRDLMRRQGRSWYGGRSHQGGRPRYD